MYDKIKNPITNRYVNIHSKLGKNILKNYINQLGGTNVCGVNPKTNRCNKKYPNNNPEMCEIGATGYCRKKSSSQPIVLDKDIGQEKKRLLKLIKEKDAEIHRRKQLLERRKQLLQEEKEKLQLRSLPRDQLIDAVTPHLQPVVNTKPKPRRTLTRKRKPPVTTKHQNLVAIPQDPSKPIKKGLVKEVTTFSKGTTDRLSAGEYLRGHGKVGDICDIRNDGELRCLVVGKNGTPSWKKATNNKTTLTYKTCGPAPWDGNCAVSLR